MPTNRDPDAFVREVMRIIELERIRQGVTQGELGERSGLGQSTVSKYLSVKLILSVSHFIAMCRALHLSPGQVMTEAEKSSTD